MSGGGCSPYKLMHPAGHRYDDKSTYDSGTYDRNPLFPDKSETFKDSHSRRHEKKSQILHQEISDSFYPPEFHQARFKRHRQKKHSHYARWDRHICKPHDKLSQSQEREKNYTL